MWSKSYLDLLGVAVDNLIPREPTLGHHASSSSSSKIMMTPPSPASSSSISLSSPTVPLPGHLPPQLTVTANPFLHVPSAVGHHPHSLPIHPSLTSLPLLQHQPNWELIQRFLAVSGQHHLQQQTLQQQQQQQQFLQQQLAAVGMTTASHHLFTASQQAHHQARLKFSIDNILSPSFGGNDDLARDLDLLSSKKSPDSTSNAIKRLNGVLSSSNNTSKRKHSSDSEKSSLSTSSNNNNSRYLNPMAKGSGLLPHVVSKKSAKKESRSSPGVVSSTSSSGSPSNSMSSLSSLTNGVKHIINNKKDNNHEMTKESDAAKASCNGSSSSSEKGEKDSSSSTSSEYKPSLTSSSQNFRDDNDSKKTSDDADHVDRRVNPLLSLDGKEPMVWPAWVYCTRYSDRPSSGPRSRRAKKTKAEKTKADEKRPRTAFTAEQLARLKQEFQENRYLTEKRRQDLARDLKLNESQIKIWFQNKRAKIKKTTGHKNPLALHLMAQGLYNHTTASVDDEDEDDQMLDVDDDPDRAESVASSSTSNANQNNHHRNNHHLVKSPSSQDRTGSDSSPDASIQDHSMSSDQ